MDEKENRQQPQQEPHVYAERTYRPGYNEPGAPEPPAAAPEKAAAPDGAESRTPPADSADKSAPQPPIPPYDPQEAARQSGRQNGQSSIDYRAGGNPPPIPPYGQQTVPPRGAQPGWNGQPVYVELPEMRTRRHIRTAALRIGVLLLLFQAVQILLSFIEMGVVAPLFGVPVAGGYALVSESTASFVWSLISYALGFLVPVAFFPLFADEPAQPLFPFRNRRPQSPPPDADADTLRAYSERQIEYASKTSRGKVLEFLCCGVIVIAGTYVALYLSSYLESFWNQWGLGTPELFSETPRNAVSLVCYIFMLVVAAPICEELFYRGAVLQSLRRFGDGFAVMVSAILFGLMHGNIQQIPHAVLGGLVFGYITVRRGTLWWAMGLHAFNNALSVILSFCVPEELLGSPTFTFGFYTVLFAAGIAAVWLLTRKKPDSFRLPMTGKEETLPGFESYKAFFTAPIIVIYLALMAVTMWSIMGGAQLFV